MRRFLLLLVLVTAATSAAAQVTASPTEEVVFDDATKRIVETEYRAARAVSARGSEAGDWQLYAGAAIEARRIELTLRQINGIVRFRADWSALSAVLDRSEGRRLRQKMP